MPSSPSTNGSFQDSRIRSVLESQSVKFHIKTGSNKWECTITDRATLEKLKASRAAVSPGSSVSESSSIISK